MGDDDPFLKDVTLPETFPAAAHAGARNVHAREGLTDDDLTTIATIYCSRFRYSGTYVSEELKQHHIRSDIANTVKQMKEGPGGVDLYDILIGVFKAGRDSVGTKSRDELITALNGRADRSTYRLVVDGKAVTESSDAAEIKLLVVEKRDDGSVEQVTLLRLDSYQVDGVWRYLDGTTMRLQDRKSGKGEA